MPDQPPPAQQIIGDFAPKLVELTDDVLFGDVWERPVLAKRDRSLITVAALIATITSALWMRLLILSSSGTARISSSPRWHVASGNVASMWCFRHRHSRVGPAGACQRPRGRVRISGTARPDSAIRSRRLPDGDTVVRYG